MVSLVSGVALFFHIGSAAFHGMHEWLSMVLIVPFALHVWKNWRPIKSYFERGWLVWPLAVSLIVALPFAWPALSSGGAGGNPQMAMFRALSEAPISAVAPVLKTTPEALVAKLKAAGVTAEPGQSIAAAAKAAGKDTRELVFDTVLSK